MSIHLIKTLNAAISLCLYSLDITQCVEEMKALGCKAIMLRMKYVTGLWSEDPKKI